MKITLNKIFKICCLLLVIIAINSFYLKAQELKVNGKRAYDYDFKLLNKQHKEMYEKLFASIDQTKIETGFLLDKLQYSKEEVSQLNGKSKKILNALDFRGIYKKMLIAQIGKNTLKDYGEIQKSVESYYNSGIIPIGIINIDYNVSKSDENIDKKDGTLEDLINLYKKATYIKQKVFLVTPLHSNSLSNNITFSIPDNFYISNTQDRLRSVEIDFDDGLGFREVRMGDEILINYATIGQKLIKSKITIGTKNFNSFSRISILNVSTSKLKSTNTSYNPPNRTINLSDLSRAYVEYGCNHSKIIKPFVFVEGLNFDPAPECPEHQYRYGTFGWDVFRSGVDLDCSPDPLNISYLPSLIDALKADGFDIIMLDFKDGAGEIGHNADILIELINTINKELITNNSEYPLIVAGASMGGVVSRYALSKMEQTNQDHNTRVWLSFDAPLKGANIPIGDQLLIDFFSNFEQITDEKPEILVAKAKLSKMAPRQLMYFHFIAGASDHNTLQSNPYYTFPTKPYTVAIVNGSINATDQGFMPGTKMVDIDKSSNGHLIDREQGETFACPDGSGKVFWGKVYIIPNSTEVEISVNGFKPYDSAPGSTRNTNREVGQGSEIYPHHCFVPIVSALGLNTTDLYFNVSSSSGIMINYPYIRNANKTLCPFNYVYLQTTNQDHIQLTYFNILAIINTIMGDDLKLQNTELKGLYEARNSIVAGTNIYTGPASPDQGMVFVKQGTSAKLRSEGTICLKTGFKVENGASFKAYLSAFPCTEVNPLQLKSSDFVDLNDIILNDEIAKTETIDSLKLFKNPDFVIYPNPANDKLFVKGLHDFDASIFDLSGRKVLNISKANGSINISGLNRGIYMVHLKSAGKTYIHKVVKQ